MSVINTDKYFISDADQKTGHISSKYNRGRHTTNFSVLLPDHKNGGGIIDTPGIREIFIEKIKPYELSFRFPDFAPFMDKCAFSGCTHINEPDCAVLDAVKNNLIHKDRYKSYLNLFYELTSKRFMENHTIEILEFSKIKDILNHTVSVKAVKSLSTGRNLHIHWKTGKERLTQ